MVFHRFKYFKTWNIYFTMYVLHIILYLYKIWNKIKSYCIKANLICKTVFFKEYSGYWLGTFNRHVNECRFWFLVVQPDPRSLHSIPCSGGPHSQHEQSQNEQFQFQFTGDLQVTDRWTYHPTGSAVSDTLLCQSMSVYLRKCADWLKVFLFCLINFL